MGLIVIITYFIARYYYYKIYRWAFWLNIVCVVLVAIFAMADSTGPAEYLASFSVLFMGFLVFEFLCGRRWDMLMDKIKQQNK